MIDGKVFAIDPSPNNCSYIEQLSKLNNIVILPYAISDKKKPLSTNGDIDHCSFEYGNPGLTGTTKVESISLDQLISSGELSENVDYLHLDVEDMEHLVIAGAKLLIEKNRPIVAYEVHLELDIHLADTRKYFTNLGYRVYTINEVLPGNRPDCRNMLAIPTERIPENFWSLINDGNQYVVVHHNEVVFRETFSDITSAVNVYNTFDSGDYAVILSDVKGDVLCQYGSQRFVDLYVAHIKILL